MSDAINITNNERLANGANRWINAAYFVSGGAMGLIPLAQWQGVVESSPTLWCVFASLGVVLIASARASWLLSHVR